jgi:hypothetical protein
MASPGETAVNVSGAPSACARRSSARASMDRTYAAPAAEQCGIRHRSEAVWLRFGGHSVLGAGSSSGSLAMFTAMRHASSRVGLIARQAVRRGDYVGNRGECGSARLALETTFMTAARPHARLGIRGCVCQLLHLLLLKPSLEAASFPWKWPSRRSLLLRISEPRASLNEAARA